MNEIPSLEEVKKSIEKFQIMNLKKIDDFENIDDFLNYMDKIFNDLFPTFHNMAQILNPKLFPFKLFRVREFEPIKNKELFCEYSYPPANFVSNGRCNLKNKPVFYCSSNPITALLEVVRNTDYKTKKFCISTWTLLDNNENFVLDCFLQSKLHSLNAFQELANNFLNNIDKAFEYRITENQKLGVKEFYKFLDSIFINDRDYSLSSYLANRRLYAEHNFRSDMIIYPSAQSESKSVNFAIQPNFVDNSMKIERFYILTLDSFDNETNKFGLSFLKYGKIDKNVILWRNLKPGDEYYESIFKEDFKTYLNDFKEFKYIKN